MQLQGHQDSYITTTIQKGELITTYRFCTWYLSITSFMALGLVYRPPSHIEAMVVGEVYFYKSGLGCPNDITKKNWRTINWHARVNNLNIIRAAICVDCIHSTCEHMTAIGWWVRGLRQQLSLTEIPPIQRWLSKLGLYIEGLYHNMNWIMGRNGACGHLNTYLNEH